MFAKEKFSSEVEKVLGTMRTPFPRAVSRLNIINRSGDVCRALQLARVSDQGRREQVVRLTIQAASFLRPEQSPLAGWKPARLQGRTVQPERAAFAVAALQLGRVSDPRQLPRSIPPRVEVSFAQVKNAQNRKKIRKPATTAPRAFRGHHFKRMGNVRLLTSSAA
jgi:hypothetical protein